MRMPHDDLLAAQKSLEACETRPGDRLELQRNMVFW